MKLLVCFFSLWLIPGGVINAADDNRSLEEGFVNPPQSAGIRCFWWWLNGNVTKNAITRDLEEMKAKGFSGALIVDAGGANQRGNKQVPAGPTFATPQWRKLFKHAVQQADKLGLELSLNIQSGWNLGGPNVTPEMAAKMLTWSEIQIEGPAHASPSTSRGSGPVSFNQELPEPQKRAGYYKDIAVLAFPLRQVEHIQREPIRDLKAKAASHEVGMSAPDCRFLLEDIPAAPDEQDTRLQDILNITDKMTPEGILNWQVPSGKWVVLRFGYTPSNAQVSTYSAKWKGLVIDYMDADALRTYWNDVVRPLLSDIEPLVGKCLKYLHTDSWECGGANWTSRFPSEFKNRRGYDPICYLPVIAGKIVENRDVSNRFLADFRKTIGDCVAENHYQVFAELAHQHNLGIHPESGGPHAGPFDALKCMGRNDIALGEFWVPSPHRPSPEQRFFVKQSSSAAHVYGKKLVGAEAFTSIGPHWDDVLWSSQKPSFDHEVCSGLNLVFVHTFTCSPKQMGLPGQEYFAGTHFNPNVTWWDYADAFITYLNRCQYLLQQGKFVADVLYYYGDHVPNLMQLKEADPAKVLPGFDYDVTNEEILLKLEVKDNCIVVPSRISYRVLVLPDHKVLSLATLKKVHELIQQGATVIGPKPEKTVSLVGFPESEKEFIRLTDEIWGQSSDSAGQKQSDKGRLIWGKTAREVLLDDGIKPDVEFLHSPMDSLRRTPNGGNQQKDSAFDYIHYTINEVDVYFVCNQKERQEDVTCAFRISNKRPELWEPVTGKVCKAEAFKQSNGRIEVPLKFAPYGSLFIVFREPISETTQGKAERNFPEYKVLSRKGWPSPQQIQGPWDVYFSPKWGGPGKVRFDKLISWTDRPEQKVRSYSGKAIYKTTFDLSGQKTSNQQYVLDLGEVLDVGIARVKLNGKDLKVLWTKPFRADITSTIQNAENTLIVEVVNSWRNRLIADKDLPEKKRYTRTNITVTSQWNLRKSGLLGPVQILTAEE